MLFTSLKVGDMELSHRVVMAPLTRFRAENNIPCEMMATYYGQRTSPGGLIITETTCISDLGGIVPNMPRIDTEDAMAGWKKIVETVHSGGGYIFCQLNAFGRAMKSGDMISSYGIPIEGTTIVPRAMLNDEMLRIKRDFVNAAKNAISCGFDGIELHGANGYLLDQFIEDNINKRADEYGGNIENRCRFPLEVLDAVVAALGPNKVGYRISPWDIFQDCHDSDPENHFNYFSEQLDKRGLAYVHIIEARSDANGGREKDTEKAKSLDSEMLKSTVSQMKSCLPNTPVFSAGGWNSENSKLEDFDFDAFVYGRLFISNPDLPQRLRLKANLTSYDRLTFYSPNTSVGYIDYLPLNA